jgi:hypothetical protein
MNIKRSLENRVRGWFPKEPNPPLYFQQNSHTPKMSLDEKTMLNLGAVEQRPAMLIITPLMIIFLTFATSILQSISKFDLGYPTLILGLIVGSLASCIFNLWQLRLLAKKGEIHRSKLARVLVGILTFILLSFGNIFGLLSNSLEIPTLYVFFLVPSFLGFLISNLIISYIWENLNKKRIYNSRDVTYAIPKNKKLIGNKWKQLIMDFFY